jgi:hypothetical protein
VREFLRAWVGAPSDWEKSLGAAIVVLGRGTDGGYIGARKYSALSSGRAVWTWEEPAPTRSTALLCTFAQGFPRTFPRVSTKFDICAGCVVFLVGSVFQATALNFPAAMIIVSTPPRSSSLRPGANLFYVVALVYLRTCPRAAPRADDQGGLDNLSVTFGQLIYALSAAFTEDSPRLQIHGSRRRHTTYHARCSSAQVPRVAMPVSCP